MHLLIVLEAREIEDRLTDPGKEPLPQPPAGGGEYDVTDPAVRRALLARDEAAGLEPVDEAGDIRVIASELGGELVHRECVRKLQQRARLRRMEVDLGRSDEKPAPLLSEQCAEQRAHLGLYVRRVDSGRHRVGVYLRSLKIEKLKHLVQ